MNSEHPRRVDHPDVGKNIEVRTLRTRAEVPIWEKDINKDALIVATFVSEAEYYTEVEVLGWIFAKDAQKTQFYSEFDNSYRVPVTSLSTPESLKEIV
jgi:hypothetical protein